MIITQGQKKEDIEKNKKENEKTAKKRIKLGLILNELGEKNNLKVEESELRNEIQKQIVQLNKELSGIWSINKALFVFG